MSNEESVKKLQEYKNLISNYFEGNYPDKKEIKSKINYLTPIAHELVVRAGCNKRMTISPPSAVGGMILKNIDPFDMVFDNPWGMSLIPNIIDMVEQAMGKYENDLVKPKEVEEIKKESKEYSGNYPDKITFQWLLNHVPMKIWFAGFALLGGSFALGVKFLWIIH